MGGGPELPPKYWHCYDLFVALTAAADATNRLRVGSGICLITQRDPIITANEVASIDHLSGGRVELGVGAGWNREELANHGTNPRTRMALMRERVEAMKAIWSETKATYHGEHVNFDRIWSYPKPAQRPHPPVLVGGAGPTVLDRVLAFGDGWLPNYDEETLFTRIAELGAQAERPVEVSVMSKFHVRSTRTPAGGGSPKGAALVALAGIEARSNPRSRSREAAIATLNGES